MVLQVTDVAAYVAAAKDRLLVWANDISTGGPLEGATVEMYGGGAIGRTGSDGLLVATTPSAIREATTDPAHARDTPFLAVRASGGRSLADPGRSLRPGAGPTPDELRRTASGASWPPTGRPTGRPTPSTSGGSFASETPAGCPQDLELRLMSGWGYGGTDDASPDLVGRGPARTRPARSPRASRFSDLPYGSYSLQLWSGRNGSPTVGSASRRSASPPTSSHSRPTAMSCSPATRVTLTARATFFDGTGVPGVRLTADLFGEQTITTDRDRRRHRDGEGDHHA